MEKAITEAREIDEQRKLAGYDQVALDAAATEGFANGAFEESAEEMPEIAEEFFPGTDGGPGSNAVSVGSSKATLKDKLDKKAAGAEGES
jgi:hypothetical protein